MQGVEIARDKKGRRIIYTLSKDGDGEYKVVKRTVVYESQLYYYCAVFGDADLLRFTKFPEKVTISDPQWCYPYVLNPFELKYYKAYWNKVAKGEELVSDIMKDADAVVIHRNEAEQCANSIKSKMRNLHSIGFTKDFFESMGLYAYLDENGITVTDEDVGADSVPEPTDANIPKRNGRMIITKVADTAF